MNFWSRGNCYRIIDRSRYYKNLKQNKANRDGIIIPSCALREGEDIFLDDYTLEDIKKLFLMKKLKLPAMLLC